MAYHCSACDFTYDLTVAPQAGARVVELTSDIAAIVAREDLDTRCRPAPEVWSVLEYTAHIRDVLLTQRERVLAARRGSGVAAAPMGREERVDHDGYNEQDPSAVARQISDAATLFSNVLARLDDTDWDRTVIYNYPETSGTLDALARRPHRSRCSPPSRRHPQPTPSLDAPRMAMASLSAAPAPALSAAPAPALTW